MATLFTYAPPLHTVPQHILMMHLQNTRMKNILWNTILFSYSRNLSDRTTQQSTGVQLYMLSDSTASSYINDFDIHNFEMLMEEMCLYCLIAIYHNQFLLYFQYTDLYKDIT